MFPTLLLVWVAGCTSGSAQVEVDGIEPFDGARAAYWMQSDPVELFATDLDAGTLTDVGEASFTPLNVLSYAWTCDELQAELDDQAEASAAVIAAAADGSLAGACDALGTLVEVNNRWGRRHPTELHGLSVWDETLADAAESPEAGEHDGQGTLSYAVNRDCPTWDPDTCSLTEPGDACSSDTWEADGSLDITVAGEEVITGTYDATLHPDGPGAEGTIHVEFNAQVCHIESPEALVF